MRILVAVDGSAGSIMAVEMVASLPWRAGTEAVLTAAYDVSVGWNGGGVTIREWVTKVEDAARDELDATLRGLALRLDQHGIAVEHAIVRGRPAQAIVDAARHRRADLVVMGSRGLGPIKRMLLGSVAAEVVADAPCPVLVARRSAVSRIVVATDGSPAVRSIPGHLGRWGVFEGVPADVVAVSIPNDRVFEIGVSLYTLGNERLARRRRELRAWYQDAAETMARELAGIGLSATPHLRAGIPAHEILTLAAECDADLIVTGTRGHSGMDRLPLGSVARNVATHAHASVLVMRPPEESEHDGRWEEELVRASGSP